MGGRGGEVPDRQKAGARGTRFLALRLAAASRRQGVVEGSGGVLRVRQRACGARVGHRVAVRAVVGVRVQAVVVGRRVAVVHVEVVVVAIVAGLGREDVDAVEDQDTRDSGVGR